MTSHAPSPCSPTAAQVVIAGAGPVGLMLAAELRLAGVDVLIVEQRSTGTTGESRAPGLNARTMELLAQRGLTEQFQAQGKPLSFVVFAGIPMDPHEQDPDWPDGWILPQHQTERILAARAVELGVRFRWSTAVTGVEQDEQGVDVRVETATGAEVVRATYLVGCDGGRSAVRKASGIGFPGLAPETWWVVGDLELTDPPAESEPFGFNDRVGRYQLSRTEPDWFRLNMMRLTPPEDPSQPVTLDEVRRTMIDGVGSDHGLRSARWTSRWSDGFRHATSYRSGRVLLAGDAAHTHTPIGGQGLNVGIQDAVNLGWKLAAVLNGQAPDGLLDTYHEERWPVAAAVLTQSMGQTELVKPGRRREAIRDVFEDLIAVPETGLRLSGELSGLAVRYPLGDGHPLLGRRMPNLALTTADGPTDVLTLLQAARPLVITLAPERGTAVGAALEPWADRVTHVVAGYLPDPRGELWHVPVFGDLPAFDAVLVRPDGHVAWIAPTSRGLDLTALLTAVAHRPVTAASAEPDLAPDPAAGTWQISFTTPRGEQRFELVLSRTPSSWSGTCNGEAVTGLDVQGAVLTFTSRVREPFPTKVRWTGTIDESSITGTAKTSFMTLPFAATRRA